MTDEDFGYQVPTRLPGLHDEDQDIVRPKTRFKALGLMDDYTGWVTRLKTERTAFLEGFPGLDPEILNGL